MTDDWYGPDTATFGDRVAAARESAGMTQEALARRLDVKLKSLQGWENDVAEPRAARLSQLAGLLDVSVNWLLSGEGDGVPAPDGADVLPQDLREALLDIRELRAQMKTSQDRLARLEKSLRQILKDTA
ncbi:helix-turn-helix domain-containing protein [Citreicella sp. C3M06]|uniref:helix-turn-helix domain-containing protein n=1 Tax=Roseobacteraceae TaxID=2854170 RepID=UPI001C089427|nr:MULTISPECIES: helix-turn-helix domain-containing protein [Roseobacteraceae]MBU2962504.1 helix-turn-helix domain-containing protein [Citreicella sp. C3M06]MDO6588282.1 helix-turn-helix domain-containing protein [Salipiger sp. 1_MG-2023]